MKIFFLKHIPILKYAAVFFIGFIIGAAAINAVIGKQIDELYWKNSQLKEELSATESELKEIKESLKKRQYTVVSIEPIINFEDDEAITEYEKETASLEIQKQIKEMLKNIVGKEVNTLNHYLIPHVIDRRTVQVDGKTYKLYVRMVIISQKILIYVDARLTNSQE